MKPEPFTWKTRYGRANEHNALVPRDHWIDSAERQAILDFHDRYLLEGYHRLTFMMIDRDVVAVSPPPLTACCLKRAGWIDGIGGLPEGPRLRATRPTA